MLCNQEIPTQFYIQRTIEFINSSEDKTIDNLKKFIGADDETFLSLKNDEYFNNLVKQLNIDGLIF